MTKRKSGKLKIGSRGHKVPWRRSRRRSLLVGKCLKPIFPIWLLVIGSGLGFLINLIQDERIQSKEEGSNGISRDIWEISA